MGSGAQEGEGAAGRDQFVWDEDNQIPCPPPARRQARRRREKMPIPELNEVLAKTVKHFFPHFPPVAAEYS